MPPVPGKDFQLRGYLRTSCATSLGSWRCWGLSWSRFSCRTIDGWRDARRTVRLLREAAPRDQGHELIFCLQAEARWPVIAPHASLRSDASVSPDTPGSQVLVDSCDVDARFHVRNGARCR